MYDPALDDEQPMPTPRRFAPQTNPLLFILLGLVIGFTLSVLVSPDFLEGFSNPVQFSGPITHIDKYISDDLRNQLVILRISDANVATCIDGEACLGYAQGDVMDVTCFGTDCRATKQK